LQARIKAKGAKLQFIIDDIFVEVGGIFSINHQHPQENKKVLAVLQ
jgi:hypothetical protein